MTTAPPSLPLIGSFSAGAGTSSECCAFSCEGRLLLVGNSDGMVRILRLSADTTAARPALRYHPVLAWSAGDSDPATGRTVPAQSIAVDPLAAVCVTGSHLGPVKVWAVRGVVALDRERGAVGEGREALSPSLVLPHHTSIVSSISMQGGSLATGSWDKTVAVWDLEVGRGVANLPAPGIVDRVQWGVPAVLLSCSSSALLVWDLRVSGTVPPPVALQTPQGALDAVWVNEYAIALSLKDSSIEYVDIRKPRAEGIVLLRQPGKLPPATCLASLPGALVIGGHGGVSVLSPALPSQPPLKHHRAADVAQVAVYAPLGVVASVSGGRGRPHTTDSKCNITRLPKCLY
jgi:hypothetical protein